MRRPSEEREKRGTTRMKFRVAPLTHRKSYRTSAVRRDVSYQFRLAHNKFSNYFLSGDQTSLLTKLIQQVFLCIKFCIFLNIKTPRGLTSFFRHESRQQDATPVMKLWWKYRPCKIYSWKLLISYFETLAPIEFHPMPEQIIQHNVFKNGLKILM